MIPITCAKLDLGTTDTIWISNSCTLFRFKGFAK